MNFMFDLQLFAITVEGEKAISTAGNNSASYVGSTTSQEWYAGTAGTNVVITGTAAGTNVYATYNSGTLSVAGDNGVVVKIGDGSYTVVATAVGTAGGTSGTVGVGGMTAQAGTVNIYGVDTKVDGSFTVEDGSISAITGTATFGTASTDLELKVKGLASSATGQLVVGGGNVTTENATGVFTYSSTEDAYVYRATSTDKGQTIDLSANAATWSVEGSDKNDVIKTGAGAATIYGGAGKDTVTVAAANNGAYVYAGEDKDTVVLAGAGTKIYVDLGSGDDTLTATAGAARSGVSVVSGDGNNVVTFGTGLTGGLVSLGGGADSVTVGTASSDNTIYGGAGDDTLAISGTSTVYGGDGADVFDASKADSNVTIADYSLTDGDVIVLANGNVAALSTAGSATALVSDTIVSGVTGGAQVVLNATGNNYYAAQFKDNAGKQYVGWVGADNAATIDASGLTSSVILVGLGNGEAGDALIGSAKNDTIYAGTNDTVNGGAGNDVVNLVAGTKSAITVQVDGASGKDTVSGFSGGYRDGESDAVLIDGLTSTEGLKVTYGGAGTAVLKGGSTTLTLGMNAGTDANAAKFFVNGQKLAAIASGKTFTVTEDGTPDYFFGDGSGVSYASITDALEVKLSDTEKFHGISTLTGGAGDSTLWGSTGKETIVAGSGATSMTGGAGSDSLVAGKAEDTFFFLAGDGKDTISGFGEYVADGSNNDLLNTYGNAITKVSRTDSKTVKITVGDGSSDVLTLVTEKGTNDANARIQFTDGTNKGIAKIGYASKANTFSYDEYTTAYLGGSGKDVISIASGNSDNLKIWLDGSQGAAYSSIDVIADNGKGDNQLAGDAASQSIQAGSGNDSLWGGTGTASDTLRGGSGNDTFFYGYGQGKDVLQNVAADDLVNLYDIDLSKLTGYEIGSSAIAITTTAGEKLAVNKATSAATTTFQLSDGSQWTANYSTKTWEQA